MLLVGDVLMSSEENELFTEREAARELSDA